MLIMLLDAAFGLSIGFIIYFWIYKPLTTNQEEEYFIKQINLYSKNVFADVDLIASKNEGGVLYIDDLLKYLESRYFNTMYDRVALEVFDIHRVQLVQVDCNRVDSKYSYLSLLNLGIEVENFSIDHDYYNSGDIEDMKLGYILTLKATIEEVEKLVS